MQVPHEPRDHHARHLTDLRLCFLHPLHIGVWGGALLRRVWRSRDEPFIASVPPERAKVPKMRNSRQVIFGRAIEGGPPWQDGTGSQQLPERGEVGGDDVHGRFQDGEDVGLGGDGVVRVALDVWGDGVENQTQGAADKTPVQRNGDRMVSTSCVDIGAVG